MAVAPIYGIAALSNALLNLWISYFVGRGEMRVGFVLAIAVIVEAVLLVTTATDAVSVARIEELAVRRANTGVKAEPVLETSS